MASEELVRRVLHRRALLKQAGALGVGAALLDGLAPGGSLAAPGVSSRIRSAKAEGSTLTIALDASPADLDPHSANDYRSIIVNRLVYETLAILKDDKVDEYEPVLAESWTANEDKSVWTFTLREGVSFHDGTPCDAAAVAASFGRMITLGFGPSFELGRFIQKPEQVTAPDAKTVVFDLGKPQPFFEAAITALYGAEIVNVKAAMAVEQDGDQGRTIIQTNPQGMGTGPYVVTDFQPDQQVVLERNPNYWRPWEDGQFEKVVIRVVPEVETRRQLIEKGEVDIIDAMPPEALEALSTNPDVVVDQHYSTSINYMILTVAGPLATPEARQAMSYAFPYDDVVNGVYKGRAKRAVGPVAEMVHGHDPETFVYPTDLAKAKEFFTAAGVAEGTEITLTQESGDALTSQVTQLFQANLAEIGINLKIENVDHSAFIEILFRDVTAEEQPNVMPWFWSPIYNDAYDHLLLMVTCDAAGSLGTNAGYYCNEQVDALMAEAADAPDDASFMAAMKEIQKILTEVDPPAIWCIQNQWPTVLRSDITGFVFNPINVGSYDVWKLRRA